MASNNRELRALVAENYRLQRQLELEAPAIESWLANDRLDWVPGYETIRCQKCYHLYLREFNHVCGGILTVKSQKKPRCYLGCQLAAGHVSKCLTKEIVMNFKRKRICYV